MKIAYFYITSEGARTARLMAEHMPGDLYGKENLRKQMEQAFFQYEGLICLMAAGITVRILGPLLKHKTIDPAVVVMDQRGQFAVSLLSGHLGGGNHLAKRAALLTGGQAVITTGTDVADKLAFDLFAKEHNMVIENIEELKHISGALIEERNVEVISWRDYPKLLDQQLVRVEKAKEDLAVLIDYHIGLKSDYFEKPDSQRQHLLILRPQVITVGVGCKRGISYERLKASLLELLKAEGISLHSIARLATIPLKAQEEGIIRLAKSLGVPLVIVSREQIEELDLEELGMEQSEFVNQTTGVPSVSAASAYLASGCGEILVDKARFTGITFSLSVER